MTTIPKGSTVVMVGTRKGLYVFHAKDRARWRLAGRYFEGVPVHNARYAEVLTRHLDEYAQELRAAGGLPD